MVCRRDGWSKRRLVEEMIGRRDDQRGDWLKGQSVEGAVGQRDGQKDGDRRGG